MKPAQFLRLLSIAMAVLFLNSCYSEYKIIPGSRTGDIGRLNVNADVQAVSIFPFIPRQYRVALYLSNPDKTSVYLSHMVVTLKRSPRKNEWRAPDLNADSLAFKPGDFQKLQFVFTRHNPLFFPHKVTLNVSAGLRDSSGQTNISQSLQFIRYMYVNVGGD